MDKKARIFTTTIFGILLISSIFVIAYAQLTTASVFPIIGWSLGDLFSLSQTRLNQDSQTEASQLPPNIIKDENILTTEEIDNGFVLVPINNTKIKFNIANGTVINRSLYSDVIDFGNGKVLQRIYSKPINIQDINGVYQSYTNLTEFLDLDSSIKINWNNKSISITITYINSQGKEKDVKNIKFKTDYKKGKNYVYNHTFDFKEKSDVKKIIYSIQTENTSCNFIHNKLICGEQQINFEKMINEQNLSINGTDSRLEITGNDLSYIDPPIQPTSHASSYVALYDDSSWSHRCSQLAETVTHLYVGGYGGDRDYRSSQYFSGATIDQNLYSITSMTLWLYDSTRSMSSCSHNEVGITAWPDNSPDYACPSTDSEASTFWSRVISNYEGDTIYIADDGTNNWNSLSIRSGSALWYKLRDKAYGQGNGWIGLYSTDHEGYNYCRVGFAAEDEDVHEPYYDVYYDYDYPTSTDITLTSPPGNSYSYPTWAKDTVQATASCGSYCSYINYCVDNVNSCTPNINGGASLNYQNSADTTSFYIRTQGNYSTNGQSEQSIHSAQWRKDSTPPVTTATAMDSMNLNRNSGNISYGSFINVTLTPTDSTSGLNTCYYCSDTSNTCTPSTLYSTSQFLHITAQGSTYIRYYCTDVAGNTETTGSFNATIQLDSTPPVTTATATSPPGGASYNFGNITGSNVNVTLSCSDSQSGCFSTKYCIDTLGTCNPSTTYTTGIIISTEGISYIRFNSSDSVGNSESTQTKQITIDTTNPNINFIIPANGTYSNSSSFTINVSFSDINLNYTAINIYNSTSLVNSTNSKIPTLCYQEFANQSYSCGALGTGIYWGNISFLQSGWFDGNWSTGRTGPPGTTYGINYTEPTSTTSAIWQVADGDFPSNPNYENVSIPSDCLKTIVELKINFTDKNLASFANNASYWCYNGTLWKNLKNSSTTGSNNLYIIEESVIWQIDNLGPFYSNLNSYYTTLSVPRDGTYYYNATAYDLAGNTNSTETRKITIDTTNPNATLLFPNNLYYSNSSSINLTANISDNIGIKNYTLTISNSSGIVNQTTNSNSENVLIQTVGIVVSLLDGIYNWFYQAFDWSGNSFTSSSNSLIIDTIPGSIKFIGPTPIDNSSSKINQLLINVTFDTTNINFTKIYLYNRTGLVNSTNSTISPLFVNFSGITNDYYIFNATTCDLANNCNSTETRHIYIDSQSPNITLISPPISYITNQTGYALKFSRDENEYVNISSINLSRIWSISIWINYKDITQQQVPISSTDSGTSPDIFLYNAPYMYYKDTGGIISWNVGLLQTGQWYNFIMTRNGTSFILYKDRFSQGTQTTPGTNGETIINTIGRAGYTSGYALNASLDQLLIYNSTITSRDASTIYTHGFGTFYYPQEQNIVLVYQFDDYNSTYCYDNHNNNYSKMNTAIPYVTGKVQSDSGPSSDYAINLLANLTDNLYIDNYTLTIYNSTGLFNKTSFLENSVFLTSKIFGNLFYLHTGNYKWYYSITDKSGNVYNSENRTIIIDIDKPQLSFISPTPINNTYTTNNQLSVTISFSDTNPNITIVNLYNSSNSLIDTFSTSTSPTTGILDMLSNGIYYYNATFYDLAGNTNSTETRKITYDSNNPNITLISPSNNSYNSTKIQNLTANISDNIGIKNYTLTISNSSGIVNQTTNSNSENVLIQTVGIVVSLLDGIYNWFYQAFDWSGNSFTSSNNTITIDSVAPIISFVAPTDSNNSFVPRKNIIINISVIDTSLKNITINIYNSTSLVNSTNSTISPFYANLSVPRDGTYYFNATAYDQLNNFSSTSTRTVTVDSTPPVINLISPSNFFSRTFWSTALSFNHDTNQYITIPTTNISKNWTVSIWINYSGLSAQVPISSTDSGTSPDIFVYNNPTMYYRDNGDYFHSSWNIGALQTGQWYNFIMTRSGDQITLYVNGTSKGTQTLSNNGETIINTIGRAGYIASYAMNALIDQLIVYNKSLSATDISSIYNSHNGRFISIPQTGNIVFRYEFDEGEGNKVLDFYNNQNAVGNFSIPISFVRGMNLSSQYIPFVANISDNIGIASYTFDSGLGNVDTWTTTEKNLIWQDYILVLEGHNHWFYNVTDKAGNTVTASPYTFFLDLSNPNVTLSSPLNASYLNSSSINFTAILNDTSGIKNYSLSIYNSTTLVNQTWISHGTAITTETVGIIVSLLDGIYNWFYTIFDWAGHSSTSSNRTVTVDTTNPLISFVYPSNNSYIKNSTLQVNLTSSDTNFANLTLYLYNSTTLINTSSLFNNTFYNLPNAIYYINATATDLANNKNSTETRTVTLDTQVPQFSSFADNPSSGVQYNPSRTYSFQVQINDLSPLSYYAINFNGTNYTTSITKAGNFYTFTKTSIPVGTYNYYWLANDTLGNFNISQIQTYQIVQNISTVSLLGTPSSETYGNTFSILCNTSNEEGTLKLYMNGTEINSSTTKSINHTFSSYSVAAGTISFVCNVTSTQNYTSATSSLSYVLYKASLNASLYSSIGWGDVQPYPMIVNITESNQGDGDVVYVIYKNNVSIGNNESWTPLVGNYTYLLNSTGGQNYSSNERLDNQTLRVTDTSGPLLQIYYPQSKVYNEHNQTLNFSAFDVSGVSSCWKRLNNGNNYTISCTKNNTVNSSTQGTVEGTNIIYLWANDTNGMVSNTSVTFYVSTIAPAIDLNSPSNNFYSNNTENINFTFTSTDSDGIDTCELWGNWSGGWHLNESFNSITSGIAVTSFKNISEGNYIWNVWCNDTTNAATFSPINFTFTIDTTFPTINFTQTLANDTKLKASNIYAKVIWSDKNPSNLFFNLYNSTGSIYNSTLGSLITNSTNWTSLPSGLYYYNVTICDLANNCNSTETRQITVDTTNPFILLTSPVNGTLTKTTSQNLTANISDNLALGNYTLFIFNQTGLFNSTAIVESTYGTLTKTIGIVVSLLDGIYNWFYQAFDWSGNTYTSGNNTITIDNSPPIITIYSPANTTYDSNKLVITYSSTDSLSGVNISWYSLDAGATNTTIVSGTKVKMNASSNTLRIYSKDLIGNENYSSVTFYVNSQNLLDLNVSIIPTIPTDYTNVTINVTATDYNTDVSFCNITLKYPDGTTFLSGIALNSSLNTNWFRYALVNKTGQWNYSVICENILGTQTTASGNFTVIPLVLSFYPTDYIGVASLFKDDVQTFTIDLWDNTNTTIDYQVFLSMSPSSYFTINSSVYSFQLSTETQESPYALNISFQANNSIPVGVYSGSVNFLNVQTGDIYNFPITYGINPPGGIPSIYTLDGLTRCSHIFGGTCSNTLTIQQGSSYSVQYMAVNDGTYTLDQCYIRDDITWATGSLNSFTLIPGEKKLFTVTYSPTLLVQENLSYYDNVYLDCLSSDIGGNRATTLPLFRPINRIDVTAKSGGGGLPGGGGGGPLFGNATLPKSFCGDGVCQPNGNDVGLKENFYNCPADCPGFNLDAATIYCFDNNPDTPCLWDQNLASLIIFLLLLLLFILSISKVKNKQGQKVPLYKYVLKVK